MMSPILRSSALCQRMIQRIAGSDRGASLVEYALLVSLIAVVCVTAVMFFGDETSRSFSSTADSLSAP